MTSSPCSLPRALVISQSDRRGESTHPLAGLHLRANDFCSAICVCVHACVYVQIADEETRRAQWCHPSRYLLPFLPPFLLVTRDSLSLAFPIYARSCFFTLAPRNTALRLPSPPSRCLRSLFTPGVSLQILFTWQTLPIVAVNADRVHRAHRVHARVWREGPSADLQARVRRNFDGSRDFFRGQSLWNLSKTLRTAESYYKLRRNCDEINERSNLQYGTAKYLQQNLRTVWESRD